MRVMSEPNADHGPDSDRTRQVARAAAERQDLDECLELSLAGRDVVLHEGLHCRQGEVARGGRQAPVAHGFIAGAEILADEGLRQFGVSENLEQPFHGRVSLPLWPVVTDAVAVREMTLQSELCIVA